MGVAKNSAGLVLLSALLTFTATDVRPAAAQTSDASIKRLYGKLFVLHFTNYREEMHISNEGVVTVINRINTPSESQRNRGLYPGYSDAWGTGQLTGRQFKFHHVRSPSMSMIFSCEVARGEMTINCDGGMVGFVRE